MSFMQKLLALVSGVGDPRDRVRIMSTVKMVADAYHSGAIDDETLRAELRDICATTIALSRPELTEEEVYARADAVVGELFHSIKVDAMLRRTLSRFVGALRSRA